jgi:hypothetical protein
VTPMNAQDLLDYHLGQMDPPRRDEFEKCLAGDGELAGHCERLGRCLALLLDDGDGPRPATGLAVRTLQFVAKSREAPSRGRREWGPVIVPFRWADLAVAAAVMVAGLLTLIPAVSRSRMQMLAAACAGNLQQIGQGLSVYANAHGFYPHPDHGLPAGAYAAQLVDGRYVDDPRVFHCPAGRAHRTPLPSLAELADMIERRPEACREALRGRYAYNAGYFQAPGRVVPIPARLDQAIPLVADSPPVDARCRVIDGNSPGHGGGGQHVLFSDMHTAWMRSRSLPHDDDIYLNRAHRVGFGVGLRDAALLPSDACPSAQD